MKLTKIFRWLITGSVLALIASWISMGLGLYGIANPGLLLGIIGIVLGSSVGGMACATGLYRGKYPRLMTSGIIVSSLAGIGWIACLFVSMIGGFSPSWLWVLTPMSGWQFLMMYLAALSSVKPGGVWMKRSARTAMFSASLFLVHIVLWICIYYSILGWEHDSRPSQDFAEMASEIAQGLGLLALFSLVWVVVMATLPRLEHKDVPMAERLRIRLRCPRCGQGQIIVSDGAACARCRLRIKVTPT